MSSATPAEWLASGCLGVTAVSVIGFALAFADTDPGYFDPRPVVRRMVRSEAMYPLWREWDNARHDARETATDARAFAVLSLRDAALSAAALLALLTITPEHR